VSQNADLTALLAAWSKGDETARSHLIDAVYGELRALARSYLRRERSDHSLPPTALVHEAFLKLIDQRHVNWQGRAHFFAIAARLMRRILVDYARTRGAVKRDGGQQIPLQETVATVGPADVDVLDLDAALDRLAQIDARQSELVELRFFGGLTVDEAAAVVGVAPATVDRDWALARAWLYRELRGNHELSS
jgi:RNA polymerase sigma factor (TIGR02999 family)